MARTIRKVIAGRYEIHETLGQGGMGKVLKCRDLQLNRIVAVKVLLANASKETAIRFHTEAKAAARLKHDNIIQVHDFGVTDSDQLYLVMEYLTGDSLSDYQKEGMEVEVAVPVLVQVADGLAHAHKRGILHRDIKPSNVMLTRDHSGSLQVKIVDFGIAKLQEVDQSLTRTGASIGTPAYMAPEAAAGDQVDAKADIYSFGCMMYRLLTGSLPFKGDTPMATMMLHLHEPAPLLSATGNIFSAELESIVAKCLEKKREGRFASMEDIAKALRAIMDEMEAEAERLAIIKSEEERPPAPVPDKRRKIVQVGFASVLLVLLLLFAAQSYTRMGKTERIAADTTEIKFKPSITDEEQKFAEDVDKPFFRTGHENDVSNRSVETVVATRTIDDSHLKEAARKHSRIKHWKLHHTKVTGSGLQHLSDLPIESLDLNSTQISNEALEHVGKMKSLVKLSIVDCDYLTDGALVHLKNLPQLEYITLSGVKLTGNVCFHLSKIPQLKSITMAGVPLTVTAAKSLSQAPQLVALQLSKSNLNSIACRELAKCKKLTNLLFLDCEITGEGLSMIAAAPEVSFLSFGGTILPDHGLDQLKRMRKLKYLAVKNSGLTDKQVKQFVACRKDVIVTPN